MSATLLSKRAAEVRNVAVDLSAKLAAGELLTGTPTVAEVTTADLTISSPGLNDAVRTIGGRVALANQAVVFTVAGGTAGITYTIRITAETDAGQTLIQEITLRVM